MHSEARSEQETPLHQVRSPPRRSFVPPPSRLPARLPRSQANPRTTGENLSPSPRPSNPPKPAPNSPKPPPPRRTTSRWSSERPPCTIPPLRSEIVAPPWQLSVLPRRHTLDTYSVVTFLHCPHFTVRLDVPSGSDGAGDCFVGSSAPSTTCSPRLLRLSSLLRTTASSPSFLSPLCHRHDAPPTSGSEPALPTSNPTSSFFSLCRLSSSLSSPLSVRSLSSKHVYALGERREERRGERRGRRGIRRQAWMRGGEELEADGGSLSTG